MNPPKWCLVSSLVCSRVSAMSLSAKTAGAYRCASVCLDSNTCCIPGREQVPAGRDGGSLLLPEWSLVPQSPESVHSMHRPWLEDILTCRGPSGPGRLWTLGESMDDAAKQVCILMGVMQLLQKLPPNCIGSRLRSPRVEAGGPVVDEPRLSLHSPHSW